MPTLLLRLCGPMQAWGLSSRFSIRDTSMEPSKSGVLGILCAALGKPREERPDDGFPTLAQLAELRMGVRVDREGSLARDYQTAGGGEWRNRAYGVFKASGKGGDTVLSTRYYLTGAHFLIGLEGGATMLLTLQEALRRPVWQLSLGRKSYVPAIPLYLPDTAPEGPGYRELPLEEALASVPLGHPLDDTGKALAGDDRIRLILDAGGGDSASQQQADVPLDFSGRSFALRQVRIKFLAASVFPARHSSEAGTQ